MSFDGTSTLNFVLMLLTAFGILLLALRVLRRNRFQPETEQVDPSELYGLDGLTDHVRERINGITRTNLYELGLSGDEFRKRENKRTELKRALKHCTWGSHRDKQYVKDFIVDMLAQYLPDSHLNVAVPFDRPERMSGNAVFACLLYFFRKQYGTQAFSMLVETYQLGARKPLAEGNGVQGHLITGEEIRNIYREEGIVLSYSDRREVLAQMIYERYKGLGIVDELRDLDIDGLSGGVSGVPEADATEQTFRSDESDLNMGARIPGCHDSIWVFHRGISIRLACIGFGSEKELRRVCQNIYRYNKAGQLTEKNGYKISELRDGSRVVVVRPPFSESWAFFVRKFNLHNISLERLLPDPGADCVIQFIRFLAKGAMITAVTGSQGSGKTTLLMEMIRHIDAAHPLRIQEMAFELHLRRLYPERNILSFRETDTVTGQAGLDLQKKTDGAVNILGEVATDEVSAWMVQMAQVASLFTLFTHHAKTTEDLILSLRNSLLKCRVFHDERIAEQQVVSVLDFDIHLTREVDGHRYVERISEVVGDGQRTAYPDQWRDEPEAGGSRMLFQEVTQSFYERLTDRKTHEVRNIIEYRDGRYWPVHRPSSQRVKEMTHAMRMEDRHAFQDWLETLWPSTMKEGGSCDAECVGANAESG